MPRKKEVKAPVDKELEENGKKLIELCRSKELEDVKIFLEGNKKVDVNYILPRYHRIALYEVLSRHNQEQMLELLIRYKADVNLITKKYGKPLNYLLHQCGSYPSVEYLKILLRSGADLHSVDLDGHSAFFLTLYNRNNIGFEVVFNHCISVSDADQRQYYQLCRYISTTKIDFDHLKNFLKNVKNVNFPSVYMAESPLFFAVCRHDLELVKMLLEKGSDPNYANYALNPHWIMYFVFLHYDMNMKMLKLLLEHKMNLNFQFKIDNDLKNETPLTWLVKKKNLRLPRIEALKLMLDFGTQVNSRNSKRQTALHVACDPDHGQTFDMEVIKILLNYDVDVNLQDVSKNTALHKVVYFKRNNEEVIKLLLQKGANPHLLNRDNQTILHIACFSLTCNPIEIIKLILDLDIYTWIRDSDENLALHHACCSGDRSAEVVELLIQKMIVQGVEKNLPFVENNKLKLQKLQNKYKFTPLNAACSSWEKDGAETVKILLQHDVNVNHQCEYHTPLLASLESFEITELLLKNGANPNQKYFRAGRGLGWKKWEAPLQQACQYTDARTVKLLIEYGADILVKDKDKNLFHYALENRTSSFEVLKFLLKTKMLSIENFDENKKSVLDKCLNDCSKLALIWSYTNKNINLNTLRACSSHGSFKKMCFQNTKCLIYDYLAKLALLGCNFNHVFSSEVAFYSQLYNEKNYNEELDRMKTILVHVHPKLCLYDVLFMKLHHLLGCSMQRNLKKLFDDEGEDFEKSYPHYGFILNSIVSQALERKNCLSSAQHILNRVFGNRLPPNLSNIILNYHDNTCLKTFVNESNPVLDKFDN